MFAHLSILIGFVILLLNIIVPVVIRQMKRDEDEFAVACAKEAIDFRLSILLWWLALVAVALVCAAVLQPLIFAVGLLGVVVLFANLIFPSLQRSRRRAGTATTIPVRGISSSNDRHDCRARHIFMGTAFRKLTGTLHICAAGNPAYTSCHLLVA